MVLDNASATHQAPFSESLPTSDLDPYANSSDSTYATTRNVLRVTPPGAAPVHVNLDALPHRFSPFFTPPHHPMLQKGILDSCRYAEDVLGRPIRQQEADALAFHFAKSIRIASYGTPVGISVATIQAWRGQAEYRFPFWSPMKSGKRSADRFGALKGTAARATWNVLRLSAYWSVGGILGSIGFAMYGLSSTAAARAFDPRLKEFQDVAVKRAKEKQAERRAGQQVDGPRQGETMEMARQRREAQGAWRARAGVGGSGGSDGGDDMSPSGGAFQEDFAASQQITGVMDDGRIPQGLDEEGRQEYEKQLRLLEEKGRPLPRQASQSPNQRSSAAAPAQESSKSTGSSWDRIRQGAMSSDKAKPTSSSQSRPQRQTQSNADSDDSFSFSSGDEDGQLAKSDSQRDFDARIERERSGKDFEERGGSGRRW